MITLFTLTQAHTIVVQLVDGYLDARDGDVYKGRSYKYTRGKSQQLVTVLYMLTHH